MNAGIVVEPYNNQHPDLIFDLILPIQSNEFGIAITRADQPDLEAIPKFYQKGAGNFWVALDKDKIVGTIALIDIGDNQVALRKMFVRAEYRGKEKGIAQRLLDAAKRWACDRNVTHIFLGTTSAYHAAHRFYEKRGFAEIAKADLPPRFPVMAVDSKFYHLKVA